MDIKGITPHTAIGNINLSIMRKLITLTLMTIISVQIIGQLPKKTEVAKVNGIEMYYEVYGEGEQLILLHGWTQSSMFWTEYIPTYAQHFTVYAVDLRGHGRTSPLTPDFTIEKSAKDILALLDHLKLKKTKAIGLSYGGLTLLELAGLNPERIESMILIGTSQKFKGGENSDTNNSFSYENLPPSFIEELKEIHYHGEDQIKALFDQNLNYQINLSNQEVQAIHSRSLIVHGDRDEIIDIDQALELYKNLHNAELWIVPNTGHIAITGINFENFLKTSVQFLTREITTKTDADK